jgi:beta-lactamase class A
MDRYRRQNPPAYKLRQNSPIQRTVTSKSNSFSINMGIGHRRTALIFLLLFVLFAFGHTAIQKRAAAEQLSTYTKQTEQLKDAEHKRRLLEASLKKFENSGVDISVATVSEDNGMQLFGNQRTYDAASISKLITAAAFLHKVDADAVTLQHQISGKSAVYWLRAMIEDSDDEAWLHLNNYLTHAYLKSYAKSIGMSTYDTETNNISAADIALLLQQLYDGDLLENRRRTLLLHFMENANYRDYIVASTPKNYSVMHKVGLTGGFLHDAAVISTNNKWLVLVVMIDGHGTYDWHTNSSVMHDVTKNALDIYL